MPDNKDKKERKSANETNAGGSGAQHSQGDYNPSLCSLCQNAPREQGSYYCPECRTQMLKTKIRGSSVAAAVISVIVSFVALLLFTLNCAQLLPLAEADILAKDGYVNSAANRLSQAQEFTTGLNETSFVENLRELLGGQEIFSLGNAATIANAKIYASAYTEIDAGGYVVETVGEEKASDLIFLSVRRYVREYTSYINTQERIYSYFAEYETAAPEDVPYDDIVANLDALKGEEGIGDQYLEYYKCYAAILADKGYEEQLKHVLNMEKLYPEGILIYGPIISDCYYQLGQYGKSIEYADRMIAKNRNYSSAYSQKFTCYLAQNDLEKAQQVCRDIEDAANTSATDSGDYTHYALEARLQWYKGEYDAALETCREGIEFSGGDAELYRQQAIVYLLMDDYKNAASAADNSYQSALYTGLNLQILNTAVLCAGLSGDDELYNSLKEELSGYGYEVSQKVEDCISGKTTVEDIFLSAGGEVL